MCRAWLFVGWVVLVAGVAGAGDPRDLDSARVIPTPGYRYCDQPYPLRLRDGRWLCMLTVGTLGETEGGSENFTAVTTSADRGATWSALVRCNKSYAVPLQTPAGRIYSLDPRQFTFSDDDGATWSAPHAIAALGNDGPANGPGHEGSAWAVSPPVVREGAVYLAYARIGLSKPPRRTEVFFHRSDNLLTERDPAKIRWARLPAGNVGLRGPEWDQPQNRSEEPHLAVLSDGALYCVWRTDRGHMGHAISRDGGITWSKPIALTYGPGDPQVIKHPLACPSLWNCGQGRYLLWTHAHGASRGNDYADRNPAWISGGVEVDTPAGKSIRWSAPRITLYGEDLSYERGRISYPGLLQDGGRYYLFTTQKTTALLHEIPAALLAGWGLADARPDDPPLLAVQSPEPGWRVAMPALRAGATYELSLEFTLDDLAPGQVLCDSREGQGAGLAVVTAEGKSLEMVLSDGRRTVRCRTDEGSLAPGRRTGVVFVIDQGPGVVYALVDGRFSDGGARSTHGYVRLDGRPAGVPGKTAQRPTPFGDFMGKEIRLSSKLHEVRLGGQRW